MAIFKSRPWIVATVLLALAGCGRNDSTSTQSSATEEIRRVVVIHLDTTRMDALSCYGGIGRTPNIDRVAAKGLRYTNSIVPISLTSASIASFMTGRLAHRNGVYYVGQALADRFTTLAEVLSERGFATGGFTSNPLVANRADGTPSGYAQGFDRFEFILDPIEIDEDADNHRTPRENVRYLTDSAMSFIDEHAEDPFFLWMLNVDPHAPYAPVSPYDTAFADEPAIQNQDRQLPTDERVSAQAVVQDESMSAYYLQRYYGEVAMVDEWLGKLLARLDRLEGKTLLVITSDHGESLGDFDIWFQHGNTIRHSCANVPLIIACDGIVPTGVKNALVGNIDIAPTILTLLGMDLALLDPDGRSLTSTFTIDDPWPDRTLPLQTSHGEPWRGIRSRDYALQTLVIDEQGTQETNLYHVSTDPIESNDVSAQVPQVLESHLNAQRNYFANQEHWEPEVDLGLEWELEMKDRLEALGYL